MIDKKNNLPMVYQKITTEKPIGYLNRILFL